MDRKKTLNNLFNVIIYYYILLNIIKYYYILLYK